MKASLKTLLMVVSIVVVVGFAGNTFAQEKKIAVKDLPAAVVQAFTAAYPHAEIKGAATEAEKGVTYYEIESLDGTVKRDLLYTADGKVSEIEETISAESLPDAVKKAIAAAYPKGKIEKAEITTREGTASYEAKVKSEQKMYEVVVDAQGKIVKTKEIHSKHKEKGEKEENE